MTKLYNDAIRLEIVSNNPVRLIPKLKESMSTWDYWHSRDEVLTYLTAARQESVGFQIFAHFALNTGARIGEILPLKWSDINFAQRRFRIGKVYEEATGQVFERTKGHISRWLGINDALYGSLLECRNRSKYQAPSDYMAVNAQGEIIGEKVTREIHLRVCRKAKLKRIRIHDLRHTYASHYIMNGGSLAELQMLLGHSTPMMTQKYAHLSPGFLESKAGVVSFAPSDTNVLSIAK